MKLSQILILKYQCLIHNTMNEYQICLYLLQCIFHFIVIHRNEQYFEEEKSNR